MIRWPERLPALTLTALSLLAAGCGGGAHNPSSPPPPANRVFVIVEENHSYSDVIGNQAMPYLNGLASHYASATQYYANVHPSIGDYFMLTAGQPETLNDAFTGTVSDDNIVRELVKANKTWRTYAESLPSAGYLGGDVYPYFQHHNPFTYFTDVVGTSQAANVVPFSQFASDLAAGSLPDFSFIVPNVLDDAHDGTLSAADQWLSANIAPLLASSSFSGSLLVIVFDESDISDVANGGGHVPFVLVGPRVKTGYQSSTLYQHQSTLRLVLASLGVNSYPGNAAMAPDMGEFFQ